MAARTSSPWPAESFDDDAAVTTVSRGWMLAAPSWLVSMVTHLVLLVMLGLCYFNIEAQSRERIITALPHTDADEVEVFELPEVVPPTIDDAPKVETTPPDAASAGGVEAIASVAIETTFSVEPELPSITTWDPNSPLTRPESLNDPIGGKPQAGVDSRDPSRRAAYMHKDIGTTPEGEAAVVLALRWLALHQRPDGSFSFDHRHGPCKTNPGSLADAYKGATGLALLPFLGAGQTHKEGQYKNTVKGGLAYLVRNMKLKNGLQGDLCDSGNMYSHGICAIALCEAYAMTNDRDLLQPAQAAINHIVYAQDPVGGGWRYTPRQPGDTSVVGWQLMALKSGHMAYLNVPPATIKGASQFLDSVQVDSGSGYGYTNPGDGLGTTSIGLLCRMYLNWKKDNGALERGVARLSKTGPSKSNMYYNYYATQVMRHYGDEPWKQWNSTMRDQMIATQAKNGAEKGSWYTPGDHGSERGGRVYCTAMATMILEVYYRHLPIYGKQAADDEFLIE